MSDKPDIDLDVLVTKGFPQGFLRYSGDLLVTKRVELVANALVDGEPSPVFLYKETGGFLKELTKHIKLHTITALDFPTYYSQKLGKVAPIVPKASYLYIFGIGEEECNNYTFSDKILNLIVANVTRQGRKVILVSESLSPTTFKRNYPITSSKIGDYLQVNK